MSGAVSGELVGPCKLVLILGLTTSRASSGLKGITDICPHMHLKLCSRTSGCHSQQEEGWGGVGCGYKMFWHWALDL